LLRSNDDPFVVIASAGDLRLAIVLAVGQERLLERVMPALTSGRSSEAGDHEYFPFRTPDSMSYRLGMVVSPVPAAQVDSLRNSCTCSGTEARGEAGLRVLSLDRGGAAGEAGLKPGDVIVAVNGRNVATRQEFDRMGESQKPGATVRFEALRRQEIDGLDWMEVRIITPKVP
jgi:S1-C subfamily serine protease